MDVHKNAPLTQAERFIHTALREEAYAQPRPTSQHRRLESATPISRLALSGDNLLRVHS